MQDSLLGPLFGETVVLATPPPRTHRTAEENLGLGYLASSLRQAGAKVHLIDAWLEGITIEELAERVVAVESPLWIGFSCYLTNMSPAVEAMRLIRRRRDLPFVAGGYGPTFHAEAFLDAGFDFVIRGEAEASVVQLSQALRENPWNLNAVGGLAYVGRDGILQLNPLDPLVEDLDSLPLPDRDTLGLSLERRSTTHVLSSRGCAAHCLFCSIVAFQRQAAGPRWRQRSIVSLVDELQHLHGLGVRHVKVVDDSLIEPPRDAEWCASLADEMAKRGVNLVMRGSIRADRVTEPIVSELRRAGFISFSCGIENFAESALRRMRKSATVEDNINALELFDRYGIIVQAGHILFDPGTTFDELRVNLELMRRFSGTISKGAFTEMFAAEGTSFTRQLVITGRISRGPGLELNGDYSIADDRAAVVYEAMKAWHIAHMGLYDKAIDPLTSPKALDVDELDLFLPLAHRLRLLDLENMSAVLDDVEQGANSAETLRAVDGRVREMSDVYRELAVQVDTSYRAVGLSYGADLNPFIC